MNANEEMNINGEKAETPKRRIPLIDNTALKMVSSPHIKGENSIRGIMIDIMTALLPSFIWAIYIFGFRVITVTLVSVLSCVLFELWFRLILRKPLTVGDLSSAVIGILIAFNMPVTVSLWVPVVGAFIAVVIVKQVIGNFISGIINPVALACVSLRLIFNAETSVIPALFAKFSPFSVSINYTAEGAYALSSPLSELADKTIPKLSYFDLIIGNHSGVIGEISALLLVAGGIYLLVRRVITLHIPLGFILSSGLLFYFIPQAIPAQDYMFKQILSGSLIFCAFFVATDYSASPITPGGRLIYGIGCGVITFAARTYLGGIDGTLIAVLVMGFTVRLLDMIFRPTKFGGKSAAPKKAAAQTAEDKDDK